MSTEFQYDNCLFPEFTQSTFTQLLAGATAINLHGGAQDVQKQILKDIQSLQGNKIKIVHVYMKGHGYDSFIKAICNQLEIKSSIDCIAIFNEFIKKNQDTSVLILLESLDYLFDPALSLTGYSQSFFENLNVLKNKKNISLLISSENSIKTYSRTSDRNNIDGSFLDVTSVLCPKLNREKIKQKLLKTCDERSVQFLNNNPDILAIIINSIAEETNKIDFLLHCTSKLLDTDNHISNASEFKICLEVWKREFTKSTKPNIDKRISKLRKFVVRLSKRTRQFLGITNEAFKTASNLRKAVMIITRIIIIIVIPVIYWIINKL